MEKPDVKQQIMDAASARFEHFGYKKTTIDEIAADVGISKGAVYLHFDSKEKMFFHFVEEHVTENLTAWDEILKKYDSVPDAIEEMFEYWVENVILHKGKVFKGQPIEEELKQDAKMKLVSIIRPRVEGRMTEIIVEGKKRGDFKKDLNEQELAEMVIRLIHFTVWNATELSGQNWKATWKMFWKLIRQGACPTGEDPKEGK